MIQPPNKRYSIKSANDIINEIEYWASVIKLDLSGNQVIQRYINDIRSILSDPYSIEQLEAIEKLAFGMLSLVNDEERHIIAFSKTIIEYAMIALRTLDIKTEEVVVTFPENHLERYLQLYKAIESIRQPDSHEEFCIKYKNRDGSTFDINTADGFIKWVTIDGEAFTKSNNNNCEIHNRLRLFIKGSYRFLEIDCKWEHQD